jgi:hypothetical protein
VQQRLRGAQRRQVKEVDFGLSFPSTTSRTTPQPELAAQLSTRRTPGSKGRGRPTNAALAEASKGPTHNASNANISAKRRKLNSDDADPSSSTRSTRSSLNQPRPDIYALPEDEEPSLPHPSGANNDSVEQQLVEPQEDTVPDSIPRLRTARTPSLPAPLVEEVTESPRDAPGSGHRKRVVLEEAALRSSQLQDMLQIDTPVGIGRADAGSLVPRSKRKRGEVTPNQMVPPAKQSRLDSRSHREAAFDDIDELSPEQPQDTSNISLLVGGDFDEQSPKPAVRRGRRSRRADEFDELSPEHNRGARKPRSISAKAPAMEDEITVESMEAEEINDQEAALILKKNRGRRVSRNVPLAKSPDLDEVTEEIPPAKKKRTRMQASTPAIQRHPKTSKDKIGTKASKRQSKALKTSTGMPIPVTVHRMTKRIVYDEDERDADILNSDIPYAKRGGVNPIDVLSELCREVIDTGLDRLEEGRENSDNPAVRREYSTKWRAVEAFGNELRVQLLEHVRSQKFHASFFLTCSRLSTSTTPLPSRGESEMSRKRGYAFAKISYVFVVNASKSPYAWTK